MIDVIFTGGTISCSKTTDNTLDTDLTNNYKLINLFYKMSDETSLSYNYRAGFRTHEPYSILSENLELSNLMSLVKCINKIIKTNPEGIIITHGTDTLIYTSSFLSYIYANAQIPIVLVSSNYILDDERSNGLINFFHAVRFIKEEKGHGVYVSYKNAYGFPCIYRGNRILMQDVFTDEIKETSNSYVGKYVPFPTHKSLTKNDTDFLKKKTDNITLLKYEINNNYLVKENNYNPNFNLINFSTNKKVLYLKPHPLMDISLILDNENLKTTSAILLEAFHSGTIGLTDQMLSLLEIAKKYDIPVYCTGVSKESSTYESIKQYKEKGVIPLYDKTPVSQYMKLCLLTLSDLSIKSEMNKNYAEEL